MGVICWQRKDFNLDDDVSGVHRIWFSWWLGWTGLCKIGVICEHGYEPFIAIGSWIMALEYMIVVVFKMTKQGKSEQLSHRLSSMASQGCTDLVYFAGHVLWICSSKISTNFAGSKETLCFSSILGARWMEWIIPPFPNTPVSHSLFLVKLWTSVFYVTHFSWHYAIPACNKS